MKTTTVGSYPKIPSTRDGINLRQAINRHENGKITDDQLEDSYQKTILRTLNDQCDAGVDIITDGQIRWLELTWPLATSMTGCHPGGLRRFYDNNVYYRMPQIIDTLSRNKKIVAEEFIYARDNCDRDVKAVLCGPITFADLSENYYYKSFDKIAEGINKVLAEEVRDLVKAGCKHIQFDEPSLPLFPGKMELAKALYTELCSDVKASCGVFIYFNSIAPIAPGLFELPVNFIGLDLVSHPGDIEHLQGFDPEKMLVAGLFDARNIMLENEKSIRVQFDRIVELINGAKMMLSPSAGLEFLPQKYAITKMKRMCDVAAKLTTANAR